MKSTGTTSWFHRDIPSARSPYTSTTWEDTKRQFVIESLHLGSDNKRKVNSIVTRKARIIHMTSAIPQEERRYIKAQFDKGRAQVQQWQISSLPGRRDKHLTPAANPQTSSCPSYKHLAWSCSLQPPPSQRGEDMWLWVMPAPQILLPSLSHSSVVSSVPTAESLLTSHTNMSHTIKKKVINLLCWPVLKERILHPSIFYA